MGATAAMVFSALGAAYGTAKSGTGISAMAIMKSVVPVVMAGIIAIYGVVVAVLISQDIKGGTQAVATANARRELIQKGFTHLGAGLSVGLSGLAAGFAIGIVGDAGV